MDNTLDDNYKKQKDFTIIKSLKASIQNSLKDLTRDIKNLEERIEISKSIDSSNTELAIKMAKWGRNNPYGFISEKNFEEVAEKQFNEFMEKKKTADNKERNVINFFKKRYSELKLKVDRRSAALDATIHETRVQFKYSHEQVHVIAEKALKELNEDGERIQFLSGKF